MVREPDFDELFRTVEQLQDEGGGDDSIDVSISHHLIIEREDAKARDGWTIERDATPEQDDISAATAEGGDWVVAEPDGGPAVEMEMPAADS